MSKEWYSAKEIAEILGVHHSSVVRQAKRENWEAQKRIGQGGGFEYHISNLPQAAQDTLAITQAKAAVKEDIGTLVQQYIAEDGERSFSYDRETLWAVFERAPESMKAEARCHLEAIQLGEQMIAHGMGKDKAWRQVAKQYDSSRAAVYRWLNAVKGYDRADWLAALLPKYKGRTKGAECSPEAWEFIKADYLRLEKPAGSACYNRLVRAAKEHGWNVPAKRTIERWLNERIPKAQRVLLREGEHALMRLFPALDRTVVDLHAGSWINGDGYQHNVFVKWPDGEIARPKTWVWQDVYSRKILSYRVDVTENTDMLRLSFGDLVEKYCVPDHATIDNTRAAANKWMSGGTPTRYRFKVKDDDAMGIFPLLGVQVHWTTVLNGRGHGQAKPVERAFGVGGIGEVVDKHPALAGAYTGHNTTAKPENYGSKAIPLKVFLETLEAEITAWNALPNRRTEMCYGVRSFDEAFSESYARAPIRKATAEQRRLWLLTAEAVRVQRDGCISMNAGARTGEGRQGRNRYFAIELHELIGEKVVVRFDPYELHEQVHVYTLDGRFIASAICQEAAGFGDTEVARVYNKTRKQFMKATKEASKAQLKLNNMMVAEQLPEPDQPLAVESKVVRAFTLARGAPAIPQQDEALAAEARQALEQDSIIDRPRATVHSLGDDAQKYQRWLDLDSKVKAGEAITDERLQLFYTRFSHTPEFEVQQEMEAMRRKLRDRIAQ